MGAPASLSATLLQRPLFLTDALEEEKWRYCYEGGEVFKNRYLEKFSLRETDADFAIRKRMSYCPAFAKQGINEIRNSIYQRMVEIVRQSGSMTYKNCIQGNKGGVDLAGSTMNYFMGCTVLPELMVMRRVGVFIDMPEMTGTNLLDTLKMRPYVYKYNREQIINWTRDTSGNFTSLILQDLDFDADPLTGMPTDFINRYRYLWVEGGKVHYKFYNEKGEGEDREGTLNLSRIPFYMPELSQSLMRDIADYQIALLNIASSDVGFITKANFPFYVESFDPTVEQMMWIKGLNTAETDGTAASAEGQDKEITIGASKGRRIAKGLEMPEFINPSAEPLLASMKKQQQMQEEIRTLLHLGLANLSPTRSSAESKAADVSREENGLSYIGQELEACERFIAEIWSEYEGSKEDVFVKYPETYEVKPIGDRIKLAKELTDLMPKIPSERFRKEIAKKVISTLLNANVPSSLVSEAEQEIEKLDFTLSDPEILKGDQEAGFVSPETASKMRGYSDEEAEKALESRVEVAKEIALAQSKANAALDGGMSGEGMSGEGMAARGVPEADPNPQSGKDEKKNSDGSRKAQRGKGKALKE